MARVGFVGTGAIAEAICTGLCTGAASPGSVVLSPRNAERSAKLAAAHEICTVAPDNQTVVDGTDIIFVCVLPAQLDEVLSGLTFRPDQTLVSLVSTSALAGLAASSKLAPSQVWTHLSHSSLSDFSFPSQFPHISPSSSLTSPLFSLAGLQDDLPPAGCDAPRHLPAGAKGYLLRTIYVPSKPFNVPLLLGLCTCLVVPPSLVDLHSNSTPTRDTFRRMADICNPKPFNVPVCCWAILDIDLPRRRQRCRQDNV